MKSKITIVCALMMVLGLLAGCGDSVESTTIAVSKDGAVSHTIIEEFDSSLNVADLEAMIQSEITEFKTSNPGAEAELKEAGLLGDTQVKVVMSFPDVATFANFNNAAAETPAACFYGTIEDAYSNGLDVSRLTFRQTGSDTTLTGDAVLTMGDSVIFYYDNAMNNGQPVTVTLPKNIAYYTDGTVVGKNVTITTAGGTVVCVILK